MQPRRVRRAVVGRDRLLEGQANDDADVVEMPVRNRSRATASERSRHAESNRGETESGHATTTTRAGMRPRLDARRDHAIDNAPSRGRHAAEPSPAGPTCRCPSHRSAAMRPRRRIAPRIYRGDCREEQGFWRTNLNPANTSLALRFTVAVGGTRTAWSAASRRRSPVRRGECECQGWRCRLPRSPCADGRPGDRRQLEVDDSHALALAIQRRQQLRRMLLNDGAANARAVRPDEQRVDQPGRPVRPRQQREAAAAHVSTMCRRCRCSVSDSDQRRCPRST